MKPNLKTIASQFQIDGKFISSRPFGSGHINNTYRIDINRAGQEIPYVFQQINHHVFKKPAELMANMVQVTNHIRQKLMSAKVNDINRRVLTIIRSVTDLPFYQDQEGNYWRALVFIDHADTYDSLSSSDQAFEVARAFGLFIRLLADLPPPPLYETIPDFHNAQIRYEKFQQAVREDSHGRAKDVKKEINFLDGQASIFQVLPDLVKKGIIPIRNTHNDTKINNVLLDRQTGEGLCVIDLDTVMPGLSLYDFGDLVRTSLSSAREDEENLAKVTIEMSRFQAIVNGFLAGCHPLLIQTEIDHLLLSVKLMILLIGMRFLTDFLQGDTYFKIHRPRHNLNRCRVQFKLTELVITHEDEMRAMVEKDLELIKP